MLRRIAMAALLLAASFHAFSQSADMFATITPGPTASPGATLSLTLTIGNNGVDDATGAAFTFVTPLSTTLLAFSQDSGPAMTLTPTLGGNGTSSGSIATFPAGTTAVFTVLLGIDTSFPGSNLFLTLAAASTTTDPDSSNDISQPLIALDTSSDIGITAGGPASAVAGSGVTDTFTVTNNGPSSTQNVQVSFDTTGALTYGATTQTGGAAASTINFEPTPGSSGAVSITIPAMLSGESASFSVQLSVAPLQTTPASVTFQVTATNDVNAANDSATVTNTITTSSDMGVTISGPATATAGSQVVYTITITNAGPSDADSVTLTDILPAGMTEFDFSQDLSIVGTPTMSFTTTPGTATATKNLFPAGQTAVWFLTATIAPGFAGSLTNTVSISAATAEPASLNNTASTTLTVPGINSFSGPSQGSVAGTITAAFTGGGAGCTYSSPQFIGSPPGSPPVPPTIPAPGTVFPFGLFDFSVTGCTAGSTVSFTITYPQPVAPGTRYWKYGPTAADHTPHWYVLPAAISGNTVTFSITDGGLGDDDLTANGQIDDPGGPGAGGGTTIPALSDSMRVLLALLLLAFGAASLRRARFA